jgi:hypothetical protein
MSVWDRVREMVFGPDQNRMEVPIVEGNTRPHAPAGIVPVPEGANETVWYRTADGQHDIKFWFKNCSPNGWRAYIMSNINYGGRASDAHSTHRLYDSTLSLHYVCWDRPIPTKAECKAVISQWSDLTIRYINEGRRFG